MTRYLFTLSVLILMASCQKKERRFYYQEAKIDLYDWRNDTKFDDDTIAFTRQYNLITLFPWPYLSSGQESSIFTSAYATYRNVYNRDETLTDFKIYSMYDYNSTILAEDEISEMLIYKGIEYIDPLNTHDTFSKTEIIKRFNDLTNTIEGSLVLGIGIRFAFPVKPHTLRPVQFRLELTTSTGKTLTHYSLIKHYR